MRWYSLEVEKDYQALTFSCLPRKLFRRTLGKLEQDDGMTVAVCPVRPASKEQLAVSSDPFVRPEIRPNYLSDPDDVRVLCGYSRPGNFLTTSTSAL